MPTRRIAPDALPSTVKSLNYLNNIPAKIEGPVSPVRSRRSYSTRRGFVAECTADNIFAIWGDPRRPRHQGALRASPAARSSTSPGTRHPDARGGPHAL